nr:hypothetical protein [uncultured Ligilactobacillus sp.]
MTNHKNLKKVLTVSTMAAATMGASMLVNADNVQPSSVSSQTSSVASVSSESQTAKSSNAVALRSSQSSKASQSTKSTNQTVKSSTSIVASSSSKATTSASTKSSTTKSTANTTKEQSVKPRSVDGNTKVTPSISDQEHDKLQNEINNVNSVIDKYKADTSLPVQIASSDVSGDLVVDILNGYVNGLDTVNDLQHDIEKLQGFVNDDKKSLDLETNAHAREIIQAQLTRDQDALAFLQNALNNINNKQSSQSSKPQTSSTRPATSVSSSNDNNVASKKDEMKATSTKATSSTNTNNKVVAKVATQKTSNSKIATTVKTNNVSSKKATKATSRSKSTMPQTGEQTKDASILVAVGTIAIAAAGALLMRKHH